MNTTQQPLFSLGSIVATPGALDALASSSQSPAEFIRRHVTGDYGDICNDDKMLNGEALADGSRILSAYHTSKGVKLWVITDAADDEGKRRVTTLLLPEDY